MAGLSRKTTDAERSLLLKVSAGATPISAA
jgi:hypothetical protein